MEYIDISDNWLDSASKEDLDKIIICFNDGQGDHCVYNYDKIVELLSDYYDQEDLENMTPSQYMKNFYTDCELSGNNTDALYFDKKYFLINWCP